MTQRAPDPRAAGFRILLAEDCEADANLLQEIVGDSETVNEIHVVTDGVEALKYLRGEAPYGAARRPDLILLDLNMPRMDGRQVLEHVKRDPDLKDIPIIVLTSSKAEKDIARSYELHANCYIAKPLDIDRFQHIVRAIEGFWFGVVELPPERR